MKGRQRGLAAVVTVAGVLALVAWSTWRGDRDGEESARRWAGEQWDVARGCFLGTPAGRGEAESELVVKLCGRLLETRLSPPEGTPWPARCVGLLTGVRDAGDADAIAALEILAPRVTPEMSLEDAAEALRELAGPIATLDEAMPPGAAWDPPAAGPPVALILESLDDALAPPQRPFLSASAGEARLFDELGERRITGAPGGPWTLERPDAAPTELSPPTPTARHPRFGAGGLVWLDDDVIHAGEVEVPHRVEGADGLALCGDAHWILAAGERVFRAPAQPIRPTPPRAGVRVACDASRVVLAWPEEGRFRLVACTDAGCAALPPLPAGGDLQLAVRGETIVAAARDPESGVPVTRRLDGDAWSAPSPAPRGRLSADAEAFTLTTADGRAVRSETGLSFR